MTKQKRKKQIRNRAILAIFLLVVIIAALMVGVLWFQKNQARKEIVALYGQGEYDRCLEAVDKGLALKALFDEGLEYDMQLYKARIYLNRGEYKLAKLVLDELTIDMQVKEAAPQNADIEYLCQLAKGMDAYCDADYADAIALLSPLVKEGYEVLNIYIGSACYQTGDEAEMLKHYEAYTADRPKNGFLYAEYAGYYLEKQDMANALSCIEAGLNLNDGSMRMLQWEEIVYYENMRDFRTAKEKMEVYADTYELDELERKEKIFLETR